MVTDVNDVRLHFNKPIDLDAFTSADLSARGPFGPIEVSGLTLVGDRLYRMDIPPQSREGYYHFTVHPTLMGVEGFPIDQNANGIPGEPEDLYSFTLILDTTPPRVTWQEPAGDVAGTLASVDVWFSEAIDKSTFTTADVAITRPDGSALAASSVQEVGFNRFRIGFAPQTATGVYSIQVGPNITDLAGNLMDQDGDGIFGEPDDDVYVATVNLVPVDLGLNNLVVHADTLWAGEPVTVSWSGFNRSGAPLLGNWTDGVYLSSDDQWDIRDVLLATVPHTGGLAENETYSQSVQVVIPGKLPDNYHILVRGDVEFQQQELDKTDNLIASDPIPLEVRPLPTDGTPVQGTLTRTDRADYYAVQVAPGDSLRLTQDGHATIGSNELYVAYEAIPTRQQSDHRSTAAGQDQRIVLPGEPEGGTYYVMVHGSEVSNESPFDLSAHASSIFVDAITPDRHANRQEAIATVTGAGFDPDTTVEFLLSDGTSYSPSTIQFVSPSTLRVTLDLPSWPVGRYDVRVTRDAASDTLLQAFEVNQGFAAQLETNLIVPNAVGFAIPIRQTIWVEYKNTGDVAMPAPLLKVTGSHTARLTLDPTIRPQGGFGQIPGTSDSVQFLGLGNSDTPWLLRPGDTGRVPVYYLGFSQWARYPQVTFTLGAVTADDGRLINWETQEDNLRRLDLTDAMWAEELQRLQRWFGLTWGEYVRRLTEAAEFSHVTSDSPITSVHDLYWLSRMLMTVDENTQQSLPGDNPGEGAGSALSSSAGTSVNPLENLIGMMESPYGWREATTSKHYGIDLLYGKGTHLAAMWSGEAKYVEYSGRGGNRVELTRSDNGEAWRYLHLDESTKSNYFPEGNSRSVSEGDGIAVSGDSGNVPAHLYLDLGVQGGSPLAELKDYYDEQPANKPVQLGTEVLRDPFTVELILRIAAPTWDLMDVHIRLVKVNGQDPPSDTNRRTFWAFGVMDGDTWPPPLYHVGGGVWKLETTLTDVAGEWGPLCEYGTLTFEARANTYHIPGDPQNITFLVMPRQEDCHCIGGYCFPAPPPGDQNQNSSVVGSFDPNDKLGPAGFGAGGYLQADGVLAYQVRFENMADATAPAREIVVHDTLDESLDLSTFELLEIAFADQTIRVPAGLGSYETSVLMDANGTEILVEVTATLDRESREFTLMLVALDAATGWYHEDPLVGLLYPNDETGRGEGYISFLVRPLADLPSGTEITNRARIVFDYNDPIDTPLVRNTLDAGPPTSWVLPLATVVNPPEFLVTWDGDDDAGGSGIARYDIFVSTDGGLFTRWLEDVTESSALFSGEPGRTYAFYSVATDNVGHRELAPADPEATTYVNIPPAIGVLSGDPGPIVEGSELTLTAAPVNDPDGEIQSVTFYRDTNGDGVWDLDDQVLEGTLQRSGDQWILSGVSTVGWDLSVHTVFARAQDNHDGWSEAAATAVMVAQIGGARVDMRMVTEPSETDAKGQVVSLAESIEWVHAWQSFWVEIWVSMDETTTLGVAGAVVDLQYDTDFLTAQQIEYGAAFTEDRTGMIDDAAGQVTAIGGRTALTDAGRSGYVLLARVRFASAGDDQVPVDEVERKIGPYGTQIELAGGYARLVDPGLVIPALGDSPDTGLWAVMYDIDENHVIDFGELSFFAAAFGRTVDAAAEPPYVWWADFDKSGRVDFGDLAFFAPNFNKSRTAVQSGAQALVFPSGYPDAWGTGSGKPTGEGEGAGGSEEWEQPARAAGVPLRFDGSQTSQAAWWNVPFAMEVTRAFVHEEHQALVPDPTGWLTDSGRELPVTRPARDTLLPATSVEEQPLRFDDREPLEDLLPLLADRPMDLTDLDAYFAALR